MYGEECVCVCVCVVIEIGLAAKSSRVNIFMLAASSHSCTHIVGARFVAARAMSNIPLLNIIGTNCAWYTRRKHTDSAICAAQGSWAIPPHSFFCRMRTVSCSMSLTRTSHNARHTYLHYYVELTLPKPSHRLGEIVNESNSGDGSSHQ